MSASPFKRPNFTSLVGRYTGTSKVYFRPDELADSTSIEGSFSTLQDGDFLVFEYTSSVQGKDASGKLLLAYDSTLGQYLMTWIDTFHNGERILSLASERGIDSTTIQAAGEYPADASANWGWRIEVLPQGDGHLHIRHYNIPPFLPEGALGVDWQLARTP